MRRCARDDLSTLLDELPAAPVATVREVRHMIEAHELASRTIGFIDAALLAAVMLDPGATLWTRDRRLAVLAGELGVGVP